MFDCKTLSALAQFTVLLASVTQHSAGHEEGYLRYVKDGCFVKQEALSCIKYKALKLATKAIFGDLINTNETFRANSVISFVPLDTENLITPSVDMEAKILSENFREHRTFASEWAELTKYAVKLIKEFFRTKGLRVSLPEGAKAIEEEAKVTGE